MLVIGAIIISFSGVWVKLAHVSPASSAFYRVFFGFIFLLFLSLHSRDYKKTRPFHLFVAFLCGILFALDLLCWHNSIAFIGPGLATLLGNFQVFILAGVGILFFKEKFSLKLIISIPLALTGLAFIIGLDWSILSLGYKQGIYLGLATALLYSAFLLTLRWLSGSSSERYNTMMFVSFFTAVILGVYIFSIEESFTIPDLQSVLSLVCLGAFSQCLGWLIISASLPKIKTSYGGLILLLQPTLAFIWDVLIFSRPTSISNWFGVTIVLISIYLGISTGQKKS